MTGRYAMEHGMALDRVRAAGAPVAFRDGAATYYNAGTGDQSTPIPSSVTGHAVRVPGTPATYLALKLVETESPTLLFVPDTYGVVPEVGTLLESFGGVPYNVASVEAIAPDGVAIAARVVVSR